MVPELFKGCGGTDHASLHAQTNLGATSFLKTNCKNNVMSCHRSISRQGSYFQGGDVESRSLVSAFIFLWRQKRKAALIFQTFKYRFCNFEYLN